MTKLLQQAIAAIQNLPPDVQDAIATRLLAEVADERIWAEQFRATTDEQWVRLAAKARRAIKTGATTPLDEVLPPDAPA